MSEEGQFGGEEGRSSGGESVSRWLVSPWRRRLASAASALVVLVFAAAAWMAVRAERETQRLVRHTHDVIDESERVTAQILEQQAEYRGYAIAGDPAFLERFRHAQEGARDGVRRLRALTADNPSQRPRLDALGRAVEAKLAFSSSVVRLVDGGARDSAAIAIAAGIGRDLMNEVRARARAVEDDERALLEARVVAARRSARMLTVVLVAGALLAAAIALWINAIFSRAAARTERARAALARANEELRARGAELEQASELLQDQAAELEATNEELQAQSAELEMGNEELQAQAMELEAQRGQLETLTARLSEEAEARAALLERERIARDAAESASRAKSDFLATMSHELRTPLNAIQGHAQLLEMGIHGPLNAAQGEALRRIQQSQRHLLSIITDILNFARVEAGRLEFRPEPVRVSSALRAAESLLAPQAAARGLQLEVVSCGDDVVVRADPERLQQILLNLVTNAIKFTPPGGRVSLACARSDGVPGMHPIYVRDTGRGIPEEKLGIVFDPFVQVDRHRVPVSQQGVGLGLAISRDLARGMGGDLVAESAEGRGSTFTVLLPAVEGGRDER